MSKFDKPFVEEVFRVYAPEGSALYEKLLDRTAYQMGLQAGLKLRNHQAAKRRLRKVAAPQEVRHGEK